MQKLYSTATNSDRKQKQCFVNLRNKQISVVLRSKGSRLMALSLQAAVLHSNARLEERFVGSRQTLLDPPLRKDETEMISSVRNITSRNDN